MDFKEKWLYRIGYKILVIGISVKSHIGASLLNIMNQNISIDLAFLVPDISQGQCSARPSRSNPIPRPLFSSILKNLFPVINIKEKSKSGNKTIEFSPE